MASVRTEVPTQIGTTVIPPTDHCPSMSRTEARSKVVAKCRSCESVFVSEELPDGTIRPIGVSADCTCGDGDFCRIS